MWAGTQPQPPPRTDPPVRAPVSSGSELLWTWRCPSSRRLHAAPSGVYWTPVLETLARLVELRATFFSVVLRAFAGEAERRNVASRAAGRSRNLANWYSSASGRARRERQSGGAGMKGAVWVDQGG